MVERSGLTVRGARVALGGHQALAGVDLEVEHGTIVAVLGPSGSGKSTLLRAIAGLQRLDEGSVTLDRRPLAGVPPHRRGIGLVFQDDALFPHRDVAANIAFGLRMQGVDSTAAAARVAELLALVGLGGRERRGAASLSGGERKRVALARALAPAPKVLLLDEPLGALDRALHDLLLTELKELFDEIGQTAVYVTHDVAEAFAVGTQVAVMREGMIAQVATPERLWATPADAWVARFIGLANIDERGRTSFVTRPEGVAFHPDASGDAVVVSSSRDGPVVTLRARYDDGREIVSAHTGLAPPTPGVRVAVAIDPAAVVEVPTLTVRPVPRDETRETG
jgi:thiamine transport system ATP-binding protein